MLDLLQFIFDLFTDPIKAIATIVLLGGMVFVMRWLANRSSSNFPLDAAPESILRRQLKFGDEDLNQNRSALISSEQIKRIRNEFLILLIAYTALIGFIGFTFVIIFWDDISSGDLDLVLIILLVVMSLFSLFMLVIAGYQLRGYIRDLRTKKVVALLSPIVFEAHVGEHMGFKFETHQYKIIVDDPRLAGPLPLHIGFIPRDVWHQVQKLEKRSAILYIAPNTSKLLSFELVVPKGKGGGH